MEMKVMETNGRKLKRTALEEAGQFFNSVGLK